MDRLKLHSTGESPTIVAPKPRAKSKFTPVHVEMRLGNGEHRRLTQEEAAKLCGLDLETIRRRQATADISQQDS